MYTGVDSDRLIFRPITSDDTDMILNWRNSESVKHNFLYRKDITREEHRKWLKEKVESGEVVQFIIIEKNSNRAIGSVYIKDLDNIAKTGEYGIFIGEAYARGIGYGTEACRRLVRYFFDIMKYDKLNLRVLERNRVAIRSYEASGFRIEVGRSITKVLEGKNEEILFMSITREEYLSVKKSFMV